MWLTSVDPREGIATFIIVIISNSSSISGFIKTPATVPRVVRLFQFKREISRQKFGETFRNSFEREYVKSCATKVEWKLSLRETIMFFTIPFQLVNKNTIFDIRDCFRDQNLIISLIYFHVTTFFFFFWGEGGGLMITQFVHLKQKVK